MLSPNGSDERPPDAMHSPPGTSLGNYVLRDRIGYGAMGAVYRAEHTLLKKAVAIKVMAAPLLDDADARERFLREGQATAALKHPNVVDVTDVGVCGATPFLVMELLEGEDLEAFLERRKGLEEWEVAELIVPIVAALASAHDQGIVHRDLKPSNIFVARGKHGEITPKVLDFGICKLVQTLGGPDLQATPFNQVLGSPSYLPPEALKGSCHVSDRCDQYSLGVVLYECVVGRTPFLGESLFSLLSTILTGKFARPKEIKPDVSALMEGIILRAMQADPESRFADMRELGRALLEVARPRTQLLWGPAFGHSEPSSGLPAVHSRLGLSMDPPSKGPWGVRNPPRPRLSYWKCAAVLVLVGCSVTALRSTWKAPAASAVNADPGWLVPVEGPTEAGFIAVLASAEPVPEPPAGDALLDPVELRVAAASAKTVSARAREPSQAKGASHSKRRISKRRKPRALATEVPATAPRQLDRAAVERDKGLSSAALANEAPILE